MKLSWLSPVELAPEKECRHAKLVKTSPSSAAPAKLNVRTCLALDKVQIWEEVSPQTILCPREGHHTPSLQLAALNSSLRVYNFQLSIRRAELSTKISELVNWEGEKQNQKLKLKVCPDLLLKLQLFLPRFKFHWPQKFFTTVTISLWEMFD